MKPGLPGSFGAQLKALREAAGYTQEEFATIAGLSVHGVSALDLPGATRDAFVGRARAHRNTAVDALIGVSLPLIPTSPGRKHAVSRMHAWLEKARGGECQWCSIARQQQALSLELRAAMSLARVRRNRARHVPVREVILPIYERFEEGFDTVDLREARGLLDLRVAG